MSIQFDFLHHESGTNLAEVHTSASGNEIQLNEIDATVWFDIDIGNKSIAVDHFSRIVLLIALKI